MIEKHISNIERIKSYGIRYTLVEPGFGYCYYEVGHGRGDFAWIKKVGEHYKIEYEDPIKLHCDAVLIPKYTDAYGRIDNSKKVISIFDFGMERDQALDLILDLCETFPNHSVWEFI